jgi:hypothetical protein
VTSSNFSVDVIDEAFDDFTTRTFPLVQGRNSGKLEARELEDAGRLLETRRPRMSVAHGRRGASVLGKLGLPVERDRHFEADKSLSAYAAAARGLGRIAT